MINKVVFFFSTYNIIIGLIITILSIFTVELIRSLSTDIIIPLLKTNIDAQVITIGNRQLRIGSFISNVMRYLVTIMILLIMLHCYVLIILIKVMYIMRNMELLYY